MAKLKFDRNINVVLKDMEEIEVPKDEVWKGIRSIDIAINGISAYSNSKADKSYDSIMLGGVLKSLVKELYQGLPLRLYNKLAKGVSLA